MGNLNPYVRLYSDPTSTKKWNVNHSLAISGHCFFIRQDKAKHLHNHNTEHFLLFTFLSWLPALCGHVFCCFYFLLALLSLVFSVWQNSYPQLICWGYRMDITKSQIASLLLEMQNICNEIKGVFSVGGDFIGFSPSIYSYYRRKWGWGGDGSDEFSHI